MSLRDKLPSVGISAIVVLGIGVVVWNMTVGHSSSGHVDVRLPDLSAPAKVGQTLFQDNCASCHGDSGSGSDQGPPLIHNIYNPGHHGDGAFYAAALRGVRGHHWRFGNMPPQPQVTARQVEKIVRFVREVQAANGIKSVPHKM
jgi:mono/diheme cytochrome c family protein